MKKFSIILIIISLIFSSCEKILDIDLPDSKQRIVVNGIIDEINPISVQVSKTKSVLDTAKIQQLATAKVKLYESGVFISDMEFNADSNYFISNKIPELEKEYKITVDYGELKSVSTKCQLLAKPNILSIDTATIVTNEYGYEQKMLQMKIKINDPADTQNFYLLSVFEGFYRYNEETGEGKYYENKSWFNSNDYVFNSDYNDVNFTKIKGQAFTDEVFNGKEYVIEITSSINDDYYYDGKRDAEHPDYRKLKIYSIPKDFYNFIISYNKNNYADYDPFAQPIQVYSNVENGLGLFTSMAMKEYFIELN